MVRGTGSGAIDRAWPDDRHPPGNGGGSEGLSQMQVSVLDVRLAHVEENIRELRADVRELRGFKLWIVGTGVASFIGIILMIIALYAHQASVTQSQFSSIQSQMSQYQSSLNAQMQTFAEYIKAVTQPSKEEKKPSGK